MCNVDTNCPFLLFEFNWSFVCARSGSPIEQTHTNMIGFWWNIGNDRVVDNQSVCPYRQYNMIERHMNMAYAKWTFCNGIYNKKKKKHNHSAAVLEKEAEARSSEWKKKKIKKINSYTLCIREYVCVCVNLCVCVFVWRPRAFCVYKRSYQSLPLCVRVLNFWIERKKALRN